MTIMTTGGGWETIATVLVSFGVTSYHDIVITTGYCNLG